MKIPTRNLKYIQKIIWNSKQNNLETIIYYQSFRVIGHIGNSDFVSKLCKCLVVRSPFRLLHFDISPIYGRVFVSRVSLYVVASSFHFCRSTDLINNLAVRKNHGAITLMALSEVYPFARSLTSCY